ALMVAASRLLRHAPHEIDPPSDEDLADADRIIARQPATQPCLVHLRDKGLLFDEAREAFVMYGVQGHTWVALGDPVGPPEAVPPLLDQLAEVSDDWLAHKGGAEKGFSLGFFDRQYLAHFPLGIVEKGGRIEAFANVWPSAGREELSIDLMRYRHDAFKG